MHWRGKRGLHIYSRFDKDVVKLAFGRDIIICIKLIFMYNYRKTLSNIIAAIKRISSSVEDSAQLLSQ